MITTWLLCMTLDARMERICQPYPTQEACIIGMTQWVDRALEWEKRSKIRQPSALSMCFPREIPRERLQLQRAVQAPGLPSGSQPETGPKSPRNPLVPRP